MSKVFFQEFIAVEEIEREINRNTLTSGEREELWQIVDELINFRVLDSILAVLPEEHHKDFLIKFKENPHDESLTIYLNEKISGNVEEIIKKEMENLESEILNEIKSLREESSPKRK